MCAVVYSRCDAQSSARCTVCHFSTDRELPAFNIKYFFKTLPFQIREDWKFVAMVVDRAQLWIFFLVTTIGTIGILMDAPHIFEFVDQDKIIDIYRGK